MDLSDNSLNIEKPHSSINGPEEVQIQKQPQYYTANPFVYKYIKDFRKVQKVNPTHAEIMLWKYLKNKQTGYQFRRQHVIGKYIADFVCLPKKLIVEVDGKIHLKQKEDDAIRTADLNSLGFRVIRFKNEDVFLHVAKVVANIKMELER